jgi:hypothetical protein
MNKKLSCLLFVGLSFSLVPIFAKNKQKERDIYEFILQLPDADKKRKIYDAYREGGHMVHVDDHHAIRHVGRTLQNAINNAATESINFENIRARFKYMFYGFVIGLAVTLAMK